MQILNNTIKFRASPQIENFHDVVLGDIRCVPKQSDHLANVRPYYTVSKKCDHIFNDKLT